jgi:hypothetical protein
MVWFVSLFSMAGGTLAFAAVQVAVVGVAITLIRRIWRAELTVDVERLVYRDAFRTRTVPTADIRRVGLVGDGWRYPGSWQSIRIDIVDGSTMRLDIVGGASPTELRRLTRLIEQEVRAAESAC